MIERRELLILAAGVVAATAASAEAPPKAAPALPPQIDPGAAKRAEEAVSVRLQVTRDAWNRGDLEAFCADYDDDAVFLSPSGVTRGRAAVLARYLKKYGTAKETMGTLSFEPVDAQATAEMVSLAMRWRLVWKDKPEAAGLTLITWRKKGDAWKLIQDASM